METTDIGTRVRTLEKEYSEGVIMNEMNYQSTVDFLVTLWQKNISPNLGEVCTNEETTEHILLKCMGEEHIKKLTDLCYKRF